MAAGLLPNEGIAAQLEYILRAPILGVVPWELLLWVNDIVPDADVELGDLEEASFNGYTRYTLPREQWTVPEVEDGCARSTWGTVPLQWVVGNGLVQTPYGYAMIDESSGVIRFIQRFDEADITPALVGRTLKLLPTYTLGSHECAAFSLVATRRRRTKRKG